MSRAEVIDKARDLIGPVLGSETSERLIKTVYAIESVADVRSLRPLLQRELRVSTPSRASISA